MGHKNPVVIAALMMLAGCSAFTPETRDVEVRVPVYLMPEPPAELMRPPITGELWQFVDPSDKRAVVALTFENWVHFQEVIYDLRRAVEGWPLWVRAVQAAQQAQQTPPPATPHPPQED